MPKRTPPRETHDDSMSRLTISRDEARQQLNERIEHGKNLLDRAPKLGSVEELKIGYRKWNEFNVTLLKKVFDKPITSKEYESDMDIQVGRNEYHSLLANLQKKIVHLESLVEQLTLYDEPEDGSTQHQPTAALAADEVFLVHGQDVAAKSETARFLERLGLKVTILHEKPNKGRTLIQKFEDYSSVGFAVVLLTPDDVGGPASAGHQPRARQNVIFELGYFIGKLGRERVCALYSKGVDLPSDMQGVLYVPLDDAGAWRLQLAKELKAAGFDIDVNKAL